MINFITRLPPHFTTEYKREKVLKLYSRFTFANHWYLVYYLQYNTQ